MAADGVRSGRLAGVPVGVPEPEPTSGDGEDGGVNPGVVSDSGASPDGVGWGTTGAAQRNKIFYVKMIASAMPNTQNGFFCVNEKQFVWLLSLMSNLPFGLAAGDSPGEGADPSEAGPANYKA